MQWYFNEREIALRRSEMYVDDTLRRPRDVVIDKVPYRARDRRLRRVPSLDAAATLLS
jgi:hypothetical protein